MPKRLVVTEMCLELKLELTTGGCVWGEREREKDFT
jgi:hypothetical protein